MRQEPMKERDHITRALLQKQDSVNEKQIKAIESIYLIDRRAQPERRRPVASYIAS
jgi:hypothetical protein